MHHHATFVEHHPAEDDQSHVIASADNRSLAFLINPNAYNGRLDPGQKMIFKGRTCVDIPGQRIDSWSLSFDGTKLATAHRVFDQGRPYHDIRINGESVYRRERETVYHLDWLSNTELAWVEWDRHSDHDTLVNGEIATDRISFEPLSSRHDAPTILLRERETLYTINQDGERTKVGPAKSRSLLSSFIPEPGHSHAERAVQQPDANRRHVRMTFRDMSGPLFDGIETLGGLHATSYSHDRQSVGYVGIRYAAWVQTASGWLEKRLEKMQPRTDGRMPWHAWPIVFLFNPYFGPLHIAGENSRRFFPTVNDRVWKKSYDGVIDHFFTPAGRFVVHAIDRGSCRLVIDEEEGPLFDEIIHPRWIPSEGCVCYLGRRRDEYYRVTVQS